MRKWGQTTMDNQEVVKVASGNSTVHTETTRWNLLASLATLSYLAFTQPCITPLVMWGAPHHRALAKASRRRRRDAHAHGGSQGLSISDRMRTR